ncbi:MAG: hypothetical protein AB7I36_16870 [Rhodospirillaceae bacterium]
MFVRCVRATVVVLAIAWAGFAVAQEAAPSEFSSDAIGDAIRDNVGDDSYVADPSESFIVEHSGQVAATAPRPAPSRGGRCREYTTDEDSDYANGLACPQADGSWRIVSGSQAMIRSHQDEARTATASPEYPDYTDDDRDGRETVRPSRRFRLDWDAWKSARRGQSVRSNGYRYE